jgi:hypothetical protein
MANPQQFARRIVKIAASVEQGANKAKRAAGLAISQAVILATPVDTGRARGNWQVSDGSPILGTINRLDQSGGSTLGAARGVIETTRPGATLYISNNLPYINRLNEGWSAQAPAGFVERAVAQGRAVVRRMKLLG